jgi:hypothetical protein
MRFRHAVAPVVFAAGAALAVSAAAVPAEAARRPPAGTHLLLTFDNSESLTRGTVVRDASGHPPRRCGADP